ncbi:MAG: hypothetical protein EOO16_11680 [Chitinophagaceae bacterium]|nr:MAG: hypothetical protein EOO16_11680 [Chitinophagaceae bacterium]
MKKSILALVALFGTGAMCWAQNTPTSTNTTTTNSTSTSTSTSTPTSTNTSTNTGTDLNGTTPNNGTNSTNTTNSVNGTTPMGATGTGNTASPVNPGNSNTTGTLQSSAATGTDYNTLQNTPTGNTQVTMQSTGNYAAYGTAANVPSNLQTSLQTTYPSAFSPTWEQRGDWYRASFNNMNRNMQVYYAPNGDNYSVALPVVQSFVPEEVVTKALGMYGNNVYSINRVRGANGLDNYQVTIIENGMSRTEFIGEDGAAVAAVDVFRSDMTDMGTMNNSSSNAANADMNSSTNMSTGTDGTMNNSNMSTTDQGNMTSPVTDPNVKYKHKVKTDDGKEMKIKTKNGKTKVKGDAVDTNATGGGM